MMPPEPAARMSRGLAAVLAAALGLWLLVSLPMALGERTVYYRDVFTVHLPLKAFGAAQLAEGRVPALDSSRGLGQPFRGNPQAAAFYPGNLLYLVLPFWSAFNLHFAAHWLLALVAMIVLARELGTSWAGAVLAGLTYAGCGWTLSALSFHHVVVATAWWPLAMAGAARGGRRGLAWGGLACGMALLGGAWVVVALGLVPLLLVAAGRPAPDARLGGRLRGGLASAVAVVAVGLIVALPQIVATARALPFTLRGTSGVPLAQVGLYSLSPLRWLELLLPLPWGWPSDLGSFGYWSQVTPRVPLVLSLHFGIVALVLALAAVRRRPGWAGLAAGGLLLAWLGGIWPQALAALSGGLFRYPEKLVFWAALAVPLLAGWGADSLLGERSRASAWTRVAGWAAGLAASVGLASLLLRGPLASRLRTSLAPEQPLATVELQTLLAGAAWLLAGLLLVLLAWALRRRSAALVAALQLAALVQLAPLVMTTDSEPFRQPAAWQGLVAPGSAVVSASQDGPFGDPLPPYRLGDTSVAARLEIGGQDLAPAPGVLSGWTYPLAPDADGLTSPLLSAVLYHLSQLPPAGRSAWLRAMGVETVVLAGTSALPGLTPVATAERGGVETTLYRVTGPAPEARWPERLEAAATPAEAFAAVSRRPAPAPEESALAARSTAAVVAADEMVPHRPGGAVRVLEATPDRWLVEVASGGGLAVLRRAYQQLWSARVVPPATTFPAVGGDSEPEVSLLPADLALLGVVVPPGLHRVEVWVSAVPETTAAIVALLALFAAAAAGWSDRGSRPVEVAR